MDNNPGTPAALRALGELAGEILEGERTGGEIEKAREVLRRLGNIFGLRVGGALPALRRESCLNP
jgi:hypothetical protein